MLELKGPWHTEQLIKSSRPPWQDDRLGAYVVAVNQPKYNSSLHGKSRFIYIGGMGTTENASLRERIGDFIIDAFGFIRHHSGGTRFYETLTLFPLIDKELKTSRTKFDTDEYAKIKELSLTPWDLEFWWYETNDPFCCEAMLMDKYEKDFKCLPVLNKVKNRKGCGAHLNLLQCGDFEKGTRVPWKL